MTRRIVVEPEWRDEPDYERLARALLRIAAAKAAIEPDVRDEQTLPEEAA